MSVTINTTFDCTQREVVADFAIAIYKSLGYKTPGDLMYFFRSKHPEEQAILAAAEDIFETLTGDSPSYDDDDLEE